MTEKEAIEIKLDFINRDALAISAPGEDGNLYEVLDFDAESLSDLFLHAGAKIRQLTRECLKIITGSNEDEENKKEFDKYAMFKLSEFLASKGYAVMVREEPSKKQGPDYYNIRLYISDSYEEDDQVIFVRGVCFRLDLSELSKRIIKNDEGLKNLKFKVFMVDKDKNSNKNVTIVKESALDETEIYKNINAIDVEDDVFRAISPRGDIYSYENLESDKYKGLLSLISFSSLKLEHLRNETINNYYELASKLAENGFITLDYLRMTGYTNENQKVLYLPKNINKNKMQMNILKKILVEFQMMQIKEQRGELREDFTMNIYVGDKLFKRFRNENFHWNGDFSPRQIINELKQYIEQKGYDR